MLKVGIVGRLEWFQEIYLPSPSLNYAPLEIYPEGKYPQILKEFLIRLNLAYQLII